MTEYIPSDDDPLISVPEIAKIFGASVWTVRQWIKEGKLKGAIKPAGRVFVPKSKVIEFANAKYGDK